MKLYLVSLLLVLKLPVVSQITLPLFFSDNMILQRGKAIHIWGKGFPGEKITVHFARKSRTAVTQADSAWHIFFPAQPASTHPRTLTVSAGDKKIILQNILVGDVWVCIGQSNMEWPMLKEQHWNDEKYKCTRPAIRLLNPAPAGRNVFNAVYTDSLLSRLSVEKFYAWKGWQSCDSNSVRLMSAVAYYFAGKVHTETGVPIGIINLSIGGAPLETFISTDALSRDPLFRRKLEGNWLSNDALPVWIRERGRQNVGIVPNAPGDEHGPNHAYKPGFAYAAGIEPLLQQPAKGILCYQGESNAQEPAQVSDYATLSALLINDYRTKWKQPQLPFYYVQLSSIDTFKYKGQLWPAFRDEQRKMLRLIPYSGMAVCSDIGAKDDVHPTNKKEVGERLARWALNKTYKQPIIPSGPLPVKAVFRNGEVLVTFDYAANGLTTSDGKALRGFSVDGKNDTEARLNDKGIIIPVSSKPVYIYYGWKSFSDANLVNAERLPASTFKIQVQ